MTKTPITPDFYQILSLPPYTTLSKQQIKLAYHKALLRNHPDKAKAGQKPSVSIDATNAKPTTTAGAADDRKNESTQTYANTYTIDEITAAYKTISDSYLRAEYDRSLRLDRERLRVTEGKENGDVYFHTGLEVVDLEDLLYEEGSGEATATATTTTTVTPNSGGAGADGDPFWYRACRCGDEKGFLITEQDLEREVEHGEIVVGCRGCSLWLKVLFAVEDGGEGEEKGEDGGGGGGGGGGPEAREGS